MWYQRTKNAQDSQESILTGCMQQYLASSITEEHKDSSENYVNLTWKDVFDSTIANFETQQKSMIQWRDRLVGPFWLTGYIFARHMQKMFEMLYWSWISSTAENVARELDEYFENHKDHLRDNLPAYAAILQTLSYGTQDMPYLEILIKKLQLYVERLDSTDKTAMLEVNLIPENYRMFIQDYAYSEGSRKFLSEVEKVLSIRFYNYVTLQGGQALQKELPIASLIRFNAKQRKEKNLPPIPVNMFRTFDENRSVLFTQHSVFEWPAGKIGQGKSKQAKEYGQGFKMIHRIIEMDFDEVLLGILKSTAFGYKIHGDASSHMNPNLFFSSKDAYKIDHKFFDIERAKEYPYEYSTLQEREEAWKECIAITARFSVPKCAKTLLQVFIQQHIDDIADEHPILLPRIRQDVKLRETVMNSEILSDSTMTPGTQSVLQKALDKYGKIVKFEDWEPEHKKLPKHGEFFQQKYMSSLCWDHTVRPYEYNVESGEDFMQSWIYLVYFCKQVHPLELVCLLYEFENLLSSVQDSFKMIDNMPYLRKNGGFGIDIDKLINYPWIDLYQKSKDLRNPTTGANKSLASFIILCIVLQDCIQRFKVTEGFEAEKEYFGLLNPFQQIDDDDGFRTVVYKKKK